jgi:hypothetical protein
MNDRNANRFIESLQKPRRSFEVECGGSARSVLERTTGVAAAMIGSFGLARPRPLLHLDAGLRSDELMASAHVNPNSYRRIDENPLKRAGELSRQIAAHNTTLQRSCSPRPDCWAQLAAALAARFLSAREVKSWRRSHIILVRICENCLLIEHSSLGACGVPKTPTSIVLS